MLGGKLTRDPGADLEGQGWHLHEYVEVVSHLGIIKPDTSTQVRLAKEFRNFIHPGRAARLRQKCDQGTALSALAAVHLVVRDLTGPRLLVPAPRPLCPAGTVVAGSARPWALTRLPDHVDEQHRAIRARKGDDLLGVSAPRLVTLDLVGPPAQVPQVLDARRHRADVSSTPGTWFLREPVPVSIGPVGSGVAIGDHAIRGARDQSSLRARRAVDGSGHAPKGAAVPILEDKSSACRG
jgi:hypothetical protein